MIYMRIFQSFRVSLFLLCVITSAVFAAVPERFDEAKIVAREKFITTRTVTRRGKEHCIAAVSGSGPENPAAGGSEQLRLPCTVTADPRRAD